MLTVSLSHKRIGLDNTRICTKTHCATHILNAFLFRHKVNNIMLAIGCKLTAVGVSIAENISCVFDYCSLHTETDSEIRNIMLTGIFCSHNLTFDTSVTEAARNKNTVNITEKLVNLVLCEKFAVNPLDFNICGIFIATVTKCLCNGKICVMEGNILTAKSNRAFLCAVVDTAKHFFPLGKVRLFVRYNIELTTYNI